MTELLTKEQVTRFCPHAAEVQNYIDLAAAEWAPLAPMMSPSVLGTNIHVTAKARLEAAKLANPIVYDNIFAEVSLDLQEVGNRAEIGVTYGARESTRLDVLELVSPDMGCVYDYKTGRRGLSMAQIMKIIRVWNNRFLGVPVVILEMRQNHPVWSE